MDKPQVDVDGCRVAHQHLRTVVAGLGEGEMSRPSALPGWSVGHVLTHLARNAEAMCRRIEGASRSEIVDQYEGGAAGRSTEIDLGSQQEATEIIDDAIEWAETLDDLFDSVSDDIWGRPVRTVAGDEHPVALLPFRRWREVEVHLVDLDVGVTPVDWPDGLVERALPRLIAGLAERADERELMAWLLGRGTAPELKPWG